MFKVLWLEEIVSLIVSVTGSFWDVIPRTGHVDSLLSFRLSCVFFFLSQYL